MSNNIYDIMKKLNQVSSMDATVPAATDGGNKTLLESTMKEVLNEKYMGFDKTVAAIKKGGSAKDPEAVAASIGRKKYGKERFQAAAAKGKKLGEDSKMSEDDMEEGNKFTGNLAKARAAGKKRADLDGDGDMETVREGAKPDYIDLDKDGNRKESMKKAAADKKKRGVAKGLNEMDKSQKGPPGWNIDDDEPGKKQIHLGPEHIMKADDVVTHALTALNKTMKKSRTDKKKKKGVSEGYEGDDRGDYHATARAAEKATRTARSKQDHKKAYDLHTRASYYALSAGQDSSVIDGHQATAREHYRASQGLKEQGVAEGTKETSTGRVHKAEPGGYGRKDDEDEDKDKKKEKKAAPPAVKRGRGRPKKNADSETGEVKKWDTDTLQSWIVGSVPKKLPGKASVKHKIKDEPDEKLDEVAPPGARAERMVKHIKATLPKEKEGIAFATAWKAHKAGKVEESIPPRFPRELAQKIYEQSGCNMRQALTAMWRVHNAVMEGKKKLDEGMTFEQSTTKPQPQPVGTIKGGVWTADPPKKGEKGVPVPQDIDGGSAAPTKPAKPVTKEDVSENKELSDVLKLAGLVGESVQVDECGGAAMGSPISGAYGDAGIDADGRMNISTNMSTDGNKTVTITADGEAAVELMQMLKMAGMNSTMGGADAEETMHVSEEKDDRYKANTTPEEEVLPVQVQTKGGNGEVAGKEKKMKPHGYKFADNPLAMSESMGLHMMREYESIKKIV